MAALVPYGEDQIHVVRVRSVIPGKPMVFDWIDFCEDPELAGAFDFALVDDDALPYQYKFSFTDLATATLFRMMF